MALNINGTTGISGVDGSVSAPAVTGTDSNTGITFPAADTIKFSTGGVERMAITNSGVSGITVGLVGFKHKTATAAQNINSSSFTDTNLTITYTPQDGANNKIYILLSGQFEQDDSDGNNVKIKIRSSGQHTTDVPNSDQRVGLEASGGADAKSICQFLEDPNISDNSNITYTLQAFSENTSSGDFRVRVSLAFTVFEIASGVNQS